ncbi:hypothetical protein [Amycolatopsis sp. NPDC004378]
MASVASLLCTLFFGATFTANITWNDAPHPANVHPVTPAIALYPMLPLVAVGLTVTNLVVGWPLFRPSQRTILRYAR